MHEIRNTYDGNFSFQNIHELNLKNIHKCAIPPSNTYLFTSKIYNIDTIIN